MPASMNIHRNNHFVGITRIMEHAKSKQLKLYTYLHKTTVSSMYMYILRFIQNQNIFTNKSNYKYKYVTTKENEVKHDILWQCKFERLLFCQYLIQVSEHPMIVTKTTTSLVLPRNIQQNMPNTQCFDGGFQFLLSKIVVQYNIKCKHHCMQLVSRHIHVAAPF